MSEVKKSDSFVICTGVILLVLIVALGVQSLLAALLFVLCLIPTTLLAYRFYYEQHQEVLGLNSAFQCFWLGCLVAIPLAIVYEKYLDVLINDALNIEEDPSKPIYIGSIDMFLRIFLGVAIPEEVFKQVALLLLRPQRDSAEASKCRISISHPYALVVGSMCAAGGFATVENVSYVFRSTTFLDGLDTAFIRACVSVPGHMLWSGWAAYHISLWKFGLPHDQPTSLCAAICKGLGLSVFFHALFDSSVFEVSMLAEYGYLSDMNQVIFYWVAFGVCAITVVITYCLLIRTYQHIGDMLDKQMPTDHEKPLLDEKDYRG